MSTISLRHPQSQGFAALYNQRGMIACMICLAAYAPTHDHQYLVQAPTIALESAFMSMCRFCFRCRRPACPMCWDDVNGICGACVQETQLSFRAEPPSLPGALPPLQQRVQPVREREHKEKMPFVCIQAGRFQHMAPISTSLPVPSLTTEPVKTTIQQDNIPPSQGQDTHKLRAVTVISPQQQNSVATQEDEQEDEPRSWLARIAQGIERVLTFIVLIILIIIVLLVIVSLISVQANTIIVNTLNIDIRAEIAYLLQLIQQIHW